MSKRIGDLSNTVVTAQVIGQIIGVTDRRVRQLAQEGVIPKLKNGSYDLVPTINAYIRSIKIGNEAEDNSDKASLDKETTPLGLCCSSIYLKGSVTTNG